MWITKGSKCRSAPFRRFRFYSSKIAGRDPEFSRSWKENGANLIPSPGSLACHLLRLGRYTYPPSRRISSRRTRGFLEWRVPSVSVLWSGVWTWDGSSCSLWDIFQGNTALQTQAALLTTYQFLTSTWSTCAHLGLCNFNNTCKQIWILDFTSKGFMIFEKCFRIKVILIPVLLEALTDSGSKTTILKLLVWKNHIAVWVDSKFFLPIIHGKQQTGLVNNTSWFSF